jgi:hypothetical protein
MTNAPRTAAPRTRESTMNSLVTYRQPVTNFPGNVTRFPGDGKMWIQPYPGPQQRFMPGKPGFGDPINGIRLPCPVDGVLIGIPRGEPGSPFPPMQPEAPANPFIEVINNLVAILEGVISRLMGVLGQSPTDQVGGQPGTQPGTSTGTQPGGSTGGTGNTGNTGGTGGADKPADDKPVDHCGCPKRFPLHTIEGIKSGKARKIAKENGWNVRIIKEGQRIPPDFRNDRITLVVDKRGKVKDAHYC